MDLREVFLIHFVPTIRLQSNASSLLHGGGQSLREMEQVYLGGRKKHETAIYFLLRRILFARFSTQARWLETERAH